MGGGAFTVYSVKAVGARKDPIISRTIFFTSFLTQGKHETSNLRVIIFTSNNKLYFMSTILAPKYG